MAIEKQKAETKAKAETPVEAPKKVVIYLAAHSRFNYRGTLYEKYMPPVNGVVNHTIRKYECTQEQAQEYLALTVGDEPEGNPVFKIFREPKKVVVKETMALPAAKGPAPKPLDEDGQPVAPASLTSPEEEAELFGDGETETV